jgi:hypothetical protein
MTGSQKPSRSDTQQRHKERRRTQEDARRWAAKLVARFSATPTAAERSVVLAELDLPYILDEEAALELYHADPQLTSAFIQRHLPRGRRVDDSGAPWHRLLGQAQAQGDEPLHFALYRAQATAEQWARDTEQLALRVDQPDLLCAELERRHPNRWRIDVGPQLAKLARERGAQLLPYLQQHKHEIWSADRRSGYEQIMELARREGWLELWAALLGSCASAAEYDREAMSLVQDQSTPEPELLRRLVSLAAAGSSPMSGGRRKPLRDGTLLALYDRFPDLLRGPFQAQLDPSHSRPRSGLIEKAIERRDDELIDVAATHLAVRSERSGAERLLGVAATTARYLEASATDATGLGRRAAAILKRVPRRSIRNRRELFRRNPLARLLFERAEEACVTTPGVAAELLSAEDDQVCAVAVRALSADDPRAIALARRNRALLLGALERRLPSPVRRAALRALDRLADGPAEAAQLLTWARTLLARGDTSAALLALVARQLNANPALLQSGEKPVVYRRTSR